MGGDSKDKSRGQKRKWEVGRVQHGGGRSAKKRDLGRKDAHRQDRDKRADIDARRSKQEEPRKDGKESILPKAFSQDEIEKEERRPKHKVAVLIGYSGTGYHGMQIATTEKTIEGDLFTAFIEAGAISKANANDPKKSQLVRCARTDKGVHASGNIISLKLIIEDKDVVEKINSHLSPQIRVWGIQRTTNSFSAYQACDSRWYEYLIPSNSFLPPHPSCVFAKRLKELAEQYDDLDGYNSRQEEVNDFWNKVEEETIKPILDGLPQHIRSEVHTALYDAEISQDTPQYDADEFMRDLVEGSEDEEQPQTEEGATREVSRSNDTSKSGNAITSNDNKSADDATNSNRQNHTLANEDSDIKASSTKPADNQTNATPSASNNTTPPDLLRKRQLDAAAKTLRAAYNTAKRSYRIDPQRLSRIQPVLDEFIGTKNFHNYTVQKSFTDPSAKRHIKSFKVNTTPIVINGTEWLSLKIHGQSFMMHQIRKMVAMIALVVRCGCDPSRIHETFGRVDASIPKAPALGLLLERPVFDSYNAGHAEKFGREHIDFERYREAVDEFKHREIYQRQFQEEEEGNQFHQFFSHTDNLRDPQLLYLSSGGFRAVAKERERWSKKKVGEMFAQEKRRKVAALEAEKKSEVEDGGGEGEGQGKADETSES